MRALVLRGFCKGIGDYAVADEIVDLPEQFFREMERLGAVAAAPETEQSAPAAEVGTEAVPTKPTKHHRKGA